MRQHQLTRSAGLALALAALAAPAAVAQPTDLRSPDTRDAAEGRGTFNAPAVTVVRVPQPTPAADGIDWRDRDAASSALPTDLRSPDTRDAAEGRGTFNAPAVTVVRVPQPTPAADGIDWRDAGIGAGALLGMIALGVAGSIVVVRRRHASPTSRQTAATG